MRERKRYELSALVILWVCLAIAMIVTGCEERGANDVERKFRNVFPVLIQASMEKGRTPRNLGAIEEKYVNPADFVCTERNGVRGNWSNVQEWTDFIYVGNTRTQIAVDGALLISPPENHENKLAVVLFEGGHVRKLTPLEGKKIIDNPWLFATNVDSTTLQMLRSESTIHIPLRFKNIYSK